MKKRILISGVFDLFHYGHMILLKKCRELYPNDILKAKPTKMKTIPKVNP